MKWIVFRIRNTPEHPYLDQIVAGTKTEEYRGLSPHWRKVLERITEIRRDGRFESIVVKRDVGGVFVCGKRVHRRRVTGLCIYEDHKAVEAVLGRKLSEQGKKDLGAGEIIGFKLGEELHVA